MSTSVTFITSATNIDYLLAPTRIQFGDLDGSLFSDTIFRSSLVYAITYLQRSWDGKYQVYLAANQVSPQPSSVPAGYIRINSLHGIADIANTLQENSIFRDPYAEFDSDPPPILESVDEQALILAAVYLLRKIQISSSALDFTSWATEDIKYSNLGSERGLTKLLENDLLALNNYIKSKIAKPKMTTFPVAFIPMIQNVGYLPRTTDGTFL